MPTSMKTLGEYALAQCDKLYHVEFREDSHIGAIAIGRRAFANCESLTKIKLPNLRPGLWVRLSMNSGIQGFTMLRRPSHGQHQAMTSRHIPRVAPTARAEGRPR